MSIALWKWCSAIQAQTEEDKIFVKEKTSMDTAAWDKRISWRKDDLTAEMEMDKEMETMESDEAFLIYLTIDF